MWAVWETRGAFAALAVALTLSACGPKSISARREHSQRLADEADEQLSAAERSMAELEPEAAEKAIVKAQQMLADPDAPLYPEFEMLSGRAKEDLGRLPQVRRAREQRDLQLAISKLKEKIEERTGVLKKALKALEAAGTEKPAVEEAMEVANEILDALKGGVDMEVKDKPYAEYAKAKKEWVDKAKEPIALARARVEFMEGPCSLRAKAAERFAAGRTQKAQPDKRAAFAEAKKLYEQCQDACRKALTQSPAISRLPILASGKKTTPEALDTACTAEWQDVDKAEKKLKPEKPPAKKKK